MTKISQILLTVLLNATWQIALVASMAWLCDRLLRGRGRLRYRLWVAALAAALALPAITSVASRRTVTPSRNVTANAYPSAPAEPLPKRTGDVASHNGEVANEVPVNPAPTARSVEVRSIFALGILGIYFLYFTYQASKLAYAWMRARSVARSAEAVPADECTNELVARCHNAMGTSSVELLVSEDDLAPCTVGWLTAKVVLPGKLLRLGDEKLLIAALGHELAHVARRDYALNVLYSVMSLPLAFHPGTAYIRRRIAETREQCCDELVTERLLAPGVYARSLVTLASWQVSPARALALTVGITDGNILEERIMTILRSESPNRFRNLFVATAVLLFLLPAWAATKLAVNVSIPAAQDTQSDEQKARAEREKRERVEKRKEEGELTPAQLEERRQHEKQERATRDREQAELVKSARVTLDQAIQAATQNTPGTAVESNIRRGKDGAPRYMVRVLQASNGKSAYVIIHGVTGQVEKVEKDE